MKKKTCAILGYGDRSIKYSSYALNNPDELEVVAVIDVLEYKLSLAKKTFNLADNQLFLSLSMLLCGNCKKRKKSC